MRAAAYLGTKEPPRISMAQLHVFLVLAIAATSTAQSVFVADDGSLHITTNGTGRVLLNGIDVLAKLEALSR